MRRRWRRAQVAKERNRSNHTTDRVTSGCSYMSTSSPKPSNCFTPTTASASASISVRIKVVLPSELTFASRRPGKRMLRHLWGAKGVRLLTSRRRACGGREGVLGGQEPSSRR